MLEFAGAVEPSPGLAIDVNESGDLIDWSVTNVGDRPLPVERLHLRWMMRPRGGMRMFRNGYQSWSESRGGAVPGRPDPSIGPGIPGLARAMFHADPQPAAPDEVRSELVTAVADETTAWVLGFGGGHDHDGTFRLRGDELIAEAFLGGAVLRPGERRVLHSVRVANADPASDLDSWARWVGATARARVNAPYQVGWCSWYQYFNRITEIAFRDNLARAGRWPFDVFQLDDGYQAAIGDWLRRADAFPTPLEELAADVDAAGYDPGLWLAPFLTAPASVLATDHPDWLLYRASGRPAIGSINPAWGGAVWVLDTTRPDVLAHLEDLARTLVAMGWRYLKLDFTYAPALDGEWHDRSLTPAQRVRQAYDAVRRGAGEDAFILGCGAPLGPCIGVVDGMRIGPDVAPVWSPTGGIPGYERTAPATENALRNTLARSFMHRRLWLNDPDCLMLRTKGTQLTKAEVRTWAHTVGASGGMAIASDDLSLLKRSARALLDDVLTVGRAVDAAARTGPAPSCPELLDLDTPTRPRWRSASHL